MKGRVVSAKLSNTVTVLVERIAKHPLYKKTFIRTKKYLVDDRLGVKEGDIVEIVNCQPVSKNKHWKVVKVVGKSLEEITEEKLKQQAEKSIAEVMPEEKEEPKEVESKVSEKEVVVDNSAKKPMRPANGGKSKKGARTELSK